jgi:hypothetical protein
MSNDFDPFDLRGQEAAKAELAHAEKLAKINESEDLKWLMSNKRGRRFMWLLLERCGVNRQSFNHSGSIMAFNEGARTVGLMEQKKLLTVCPELYMTMLTEALTND